MLPIEKIVTATDFSEPSRSGVAAASELAAHFGAELVLLHVTAPLKSVSGATTVAGYYLPTVEEEMAVEAAGMTEAVLKEEVSSAVTASFRILQGKPAEKIAEQAEKEGAGLIVMASRGESGWKAFFTGSVAERVIRYAGCPVLTVNAPKKEK